MDRPAKISVDSYGTSNIQLARSALEAKTRRFARRSIARNTERGYRSDWADLPEFCDQHGRQALPADPETVALYYAGLAEAGAKPSTIKRRQASIKKAHQLAGRLSPTDDPRPKAVMAGIRRELAVRPNQKSPLITDLVRQLLKHTPTTTEAGLRDRALLLLGFSSGRRRSELVALDVKDLREVADGYRVLIRRSKTDQEGEGKEIGIPYGQHSDTCPVTALNVYLRTAGLETGPHFRPVNRNGELRKGYRAEDGFWREWRMTPDNVALVVKHWIQESGLSPTDFRRPLTPCRAGHPVGRRRSFGEGDHGPDGPLRRRDGEAVHPQRAIVRRERR